VSETVTVACKIPAGLILRIFEFEEQAEPMFGGGTRAVRLSREVANAPRVKLNGPAHRQDRAPVQSISGGYGLTFGVPKDFWDRWLEQNQTAEFVKNGLVFAHTKSSMAEDEAKEKAKLKTGFERIDPSKPPRGIETVNQRAA